MSSLAVGRGTGPNSGVIGVAPEATVMPISVAFGEAGVDSDGQIAEAVKYAVDHGAKVINMSLTRNTLAWPTSWDDAFLYAMQHDVVVVAAAGNRGSGTTVIGAPATMPGVLAVAGVDRGGNASVGASSQGITLGVAAPSEQLVGVVPGGSYVSWSGTSGATPIVAGIVALVRAAHPGLDAANVIERLIDTAHDKGATGPDATYGYGLVDAAAAVSATGVPTVTANPLGDPRRVDPGPPPGRRASRTAADAGRRRPAGRCRRRGGPGEPSRPPRAEPVPAPAGRHSRARRRAAPRRARGGGRAGVPSRGGGPTEPVGSSGALLSKKGPPLVPKILIVGGGYAGFYAAWRLEKLLGRDEAEVTMVDPLSYMTYQPFLPEVAAGSIEPHHAVVAHRRHLKRTRLISAKVTAIDPVAKVATLSAMEGPDWTIDYDILVVTAGSVTRTFPIPGVADTAFGMKNIEEAIAVRDRLIGNFNRASNLHKGDPIKQRLLTVAVVGGGFAGVETVAELRSLSSYLVRYYPTIDWDETQFHLIEALGRIMPEVTEDSAKWVVSDLEKHGVQVHLNAALQSAENGVIEIAGAEKFESDLLIWTAGVMAHPTAKQFGLPLEPRGRIRVNANLQVVHEDGSLFGDVWSCGDVAMVPDLTGKGLPDGSCVPNAQHAVRQAKRLAKNLKATLRGEHPIEYLHKNLGAVAGLGPWDGVMKFTPLNISARGWIGWLGHRVYHGFAMPSWERKIRVVTDWSNGFWLRREIATLNVGRPRAAFQEYALRPLARAERPEEKPAKAPREKAAAAESK